MRRAREVSTIYENLVLRSSYRSYRYDYTLKFLMIRGRIVPSRRRVECDLNRRVQFANFLSQSGAAERARTRLYRASGVA